MKHLGWIWGSGAGGAVCVGAWKPSCQAGVPGFASETLLPSGCSEPYNDPWAAPARPCHLVVPTPWGS